MNVKNRRFRHIPVLCFLVFLQGFLSGQEEGSRGSPGMDAEPEQNRSGQAQTPGIENPTGTEAPESADSATIFYIKDIAFEIQGRSRPFALMYHGEFKKGEQLEGEAALDGYIKNKTQLLINQRVLDAAEIEHTRGGPEADGRVPVYLLVKVVDTWNAIIVPDPRYDSNSGWQLILKTRDYNFLGTMNPLRIDLGYIHKEGDSQIGPPQDVFKFEIDSDTPFEAFGLKWNLNFDHLFSYTLAAAEGFLSYKNTTGLSVEFPIKTTKLTVGFDQSSILNEENPARYQAEYGNAAPFYMSSKPYGSWEIPLGLKVSRFGELAYTPEVSGNLSYRAGEGIDFWRKGPSITLSHSLGFGQVNWIGNYRNGLEASLGNINTYNWYREGWENDYGISVTWHRILAEFLGVSGRFQFRQWFFDEAFAAPQYPDHTQIGNNLRGIVDSSVIVKHGGFMFALNLDFPLRVLHFVPSEWLYTGKLHEWLQDKKLIRLLDFDLHISPFIDTALVRGSKAAWGDAGEVEENDASFIPFIPFSPKGMLTGIGLELVVFPAFMRSVYLRASVGYNLNKFLETRNLPLWDELFIGFGHHY